MDTVRWLLLGIALAGCGGPGGRDVGPLDRDEGWEFDIPSSCNPDLGVCCPADEPEEEDICPELALCDCTAEDGQQVDPDDLGVHPPGPFRCPVHEMDYCRLDSGLCKTCRPKAPDEDDNPKHFDCDDYAHLCAIWGVQNDIKICQMTFEGTRDPSSRVRTCRNGKCGKKYPDTGGGWAHAINVVEYANEYCLVEPQASPDRAKICCWPKGPGSSIYDPPQSCLEDACARSGGKRDASCKKRKIWCDPEPSPNAGEKPFWVRPEICELIGDTCKIDLGPYVCDCDNAVGAEEREANGWECDPDSCKFYPNGNDRECRCNWSRTLSTTGTGTGSGTGGSTG